jgi:hypothetical protein
VSNAAPEGFFNSLLENQKAIFLRIYHTIARASAKTRKRIAALIKGEVSEVDKSMLIPEAMRLIVEEALEGEVADALGRWFYAHEAATGSCYRNGYRTATYYIGRTTATASWSPHRCRWLPGSSATK